MGVHEELRRLDEDLAAGRLDAESYRRRRDTLLAARPPTAPPPPGPPLTAPTRASSGFPEAHPAAAPAPGPDPVEAAEPRPERVPDLGVPPAARSRSTPAEIAAGGAGRVDGAPTTARPDQGAGGSGDDRTGSLTAALGGTHPHARSAPPPLPPPAARPEPSVPPPAARPEPVVAEPVVAPPVVSEPVAAEPTAGDGAGGREREVTAPSAADPFPPPFRWDDASGAASATATQVVAPGDARVRPETVADPVVGSLVRGLDDPLAPPRPPDASPDRTQVVPGAGAPGGAGRTQIVDRSRFPTTPRTPPPRGAGPLGPTPPPERTQVVPGAAVARTGDRRPVPARDTRPPWVTAAPTSPPVGERTPGRELFALGAGPSAGTVVGTLAVLGLVAVVLVLSFLLA